MAGTSNAIDQNTNQFLKLSGGTMAGTISMASHSITGLPTPSADSDAATKSYVDTVAQGLNILAAAYAATIAPLNATYSNGSSGVGATLTNAGTMAAFTLDGTTPPLNSRILVKDQSSTFQNGVYTLTTVGSGAANWVLTRATDYNTAAQINPGDFILINNGDTNSATGWVQTATVTTIGTDPINFSLFSSPQAAVNPNIIIGGNFSTNPWQRGTSFTAPATLTYTADRWQWQTGGIGVLNILKTADAPTVSQAGVYSDFCLDADVTTANGSIGVGDVARHIYNMEGYDFSQIAQRPFTLSFWVKSTITGTYSIGMRNSGGDRFYIAEYTVNTSNTWERKVIVVPASPSGGTWDYTNGLGLAFYFNIAAGPNFQTSSVGSWQTGGSSASSNQVNGISSTSNNFKLDLVKVEPGPYATAWPFRSREEELALCQRYYWKSFNQGVIPAQASATQVGAIEYRGNVAGVNNQSSYVTFPVAMRTTPTITFYNPVNAATTWYNYTDAANSGASSTDALGARGFSAVNAQVAGDGVGELLAIHSSASAEF